MAARGREAELMVRMAEKSLPCFGDDKSLFPFTGKIPEKRFDCASDYPVCLFLQALVL
ncbi:MAG TPA: hypothetical protein VMK31_04665 [Sphingomicrobium sp.]|nr:hypothetical protein [Sphingomicrobium sp.]